ncbi:MAG: hypothetical protein O3A47_06810, partial [Chloroflexi bacterium]|nr:hypothetical protein [Chloroflexota bacterium]
MAQTSPRNLERNIRNEERRQAAADAAAAARRLYDQQILNSPGQLRTESAISPWRGRMSSGIKERLEAADVERRSYEAQLLNSPGMLRTESAISPWRGRMSSGIEELLAGPNREARRAKVYQESEAYRNQVDAYYNDKVRRGTAGLATPTTQSPLNNFLSELPGAVREQLSFSGSDTAGSDVGLEGNINRIYQQMIGQPAKAVGRFFTGDQRAAQIPPRQFEKFRIGDGGNVPQGAPQPTLPTH